MTKTIPKKKKCKKTKWLSEEALQITEERRDMKGKGQRERYTGLNGEFKRITGRDKKPFLNEQCKGTEENNRMGKPRDFLKKKKLEISREHFIKDRNFKDLTEVEEIKKR